MSTINVATITADYILGANVLVGNSTSNMSIAANSVSITFGSNVVIKSDRIEVGNSFINTVINSTSISVSSITLNSVSYSAIAPTQVLVDYQVFTNPSADNKWYKPSWVQDNDIVTIMMWGGGGSAGHDPGASASGGGGGACVIANRLAGDCNSVCNVVVGAGGAAATDETPGNNGGNSAFWSNSTFSITAYGGGGAFANSTFTRAGAGGGWFGVQATTNTSASGGGPLGGTPSATASTRDSTFGGGAGANATLINGGSSVYGGGGGAYFTGTGGSSIYGGGGGGHTGPAGISIFGGNGGNATITATAPGGGGGFQVAGARGEVRVWVTGQARGIGDVPLFYSMSSDKSSVVEANSVTFTVTTLNVPNGTVLYYTLNNSSTATSADFSTAVNGSITINGGSNTFTLSVNNDADSTETFYMDLRVDSSTGNIVANSASVSISPLIVGGDIIFFANTSTALDTATINMPSGLQQDDMVMVVQIGTTSGTIPAGWSELAISGAVNGTGSGYFKAFYKFMGATPDTSVTLPAPIGASIAFAARFVNSSSPFDGTASATAVGISQPPAITTTKANSFVIAVGYGWSGFASVAVPSGYTRIAITFNSSEGILAAYKKVLVPGTENPGAMSVSADDEQAVTFAIKNNL